MAMGSAPVRQVAKHALARPSFLAPRYPCYGLLPGGSGAGCGHMSLISKEFVFRLRALPVLPAKAACQRYGSSDG